jgi:site-specific recombinase XerD
MKVSFYLKRPKATSHTTIFARISYNGKQLKYYTSENIEPKNWSKVNYRAKESMRFREYPEFNARLDSIEATIKSTYRKYLNDHQHEIPSTSLLKELLDRIFHREKKQGNNTFFTFFDELIKQTKNGLRLHPQTGKPFSKATAKVYNTTYKHLQNYQVTRRRRIDFDVIDLSFYMDFKEYLLSEVKLSTNALGKNIQVLKLVLNEATELGVNRNLAFKSKRFTTVREDSESIYLTEAEIKGLEKLDLSKNERLDKVRDLFVIGCYTGLRYSDYSKLQSIHFEEGFIKVMQIKTGRAVMIPRHPTVDRIFAKYNGDLPQSISNQKTNEYLKELGKMVPSLQLPISKSITKGGDRISKTHHKWELLSSHTARRSFATNMYLQGIPSISIMAITGHKTEKAFLKYIKLTSKEHAKLVAGHWKKQRDLQVV